MFVIRYSPSTRSASFGPARASVPSASEGPAPDPLYPVILSRKESACFSCVPVLNSPFAGCAARRDTFEDSSAAGGNTEMAEKRTRLEFCHELTRTAEDRGRTTEDGRRTNSHNHEGHEEREGHREITADERKWTRRTWKNGQPSIKNRK